MSEAPRHIHIDRLDLDVRGISPTTVAAAAHAIGPALQHALAHEPGNATIDRRPIRTSMDIGAPGLAAVVAQRIAAVIRAQQVGLKSQPPQTTSEV